MGRKGGVGNPKLEVWAHAFLAEALLSAQKSTLGPQARDVGACVPRRALFSAQKLTPGLQVGVLGRVRSSKGRFYPPKNGPRAPKLVC